MGAEHSTEMNSTNFEMRRFSDSQSGTSVTGLQAPLRGILRQPTAHDSEDSVTNSVNSSPPSARRSVVWRDEHQKKSSIINERSLFKTATAKRLETDRELNPIHVHPPPKWNQNNNLQRPVIIDVATVRKTKKRAPQPPEEINQHQNMNEDRVLSHQTNRSLPTNLRVRMERDRLLNEIKIGLANKPQMDSTYISEFKSDGQLNRFSKDPVSTSQRNNNKPTGFYRDPTDDLENDNNLKGFHKSENILQRNNQPTGLFKKSTQNLQNYMIPSNSTHNLRNEVNLAKFQQDDRKSYLQRNNNSTDLDNNLIRDEQKSEVPILKLHRNFKAKRPSAMPVILISNHRIEKSQMESSDLDHVKDIISSDGAVTNVFNDPSVDIEFTGRKFTTFIETSKAGRELEQSVVIMPEEEGDGLPNTEETMIYQFLSDSCSHQQNDNDSMEELSSQVSPQICFDHMSSNSSGYESQVARIDIAVQTSDDLLSAAMEHKQRRFLPKTPSQIDQTGLSKFDVVQSAQYIDPKVQIGSPKRLQAHQDSTNSLIKLRPPQYSGLPQISKISLQPEIVLPTEEERSTRSTITGNSRPINSSHQNGTRYEPFVIAKEEQNQKKVLNEIEQQNNERHSFDSNRYSWNSLKRFGNSISKVFGSLKIHGSRERGSINNVFQTKTSSDGWNYDVTGSFHDLSSAEMMPSNSSSKANERRLQLAWREVARQSHQNLFTTNPLFQADDS